MPDTAIEQTRSTQKRIVVGFDRMGQGLADAVTSALTAHGVAFHLVEGSGEADYPDVAVDACRQVISERLHSAILVCGTGLGMSIAANKVHGIRAARCTDTYSVEKARRNSDANVLTLGAEVTTSAVAAMLVTTWLSYAFDSERSRPKLLKISELEATGGRRG
jgi:RpiB/LacA/LacB family sugar-phosphate isomerase